MWAQSDKNTLEKRTVILGDYDSGNDRYQIESGVTEEDFIAYPKEDMQEGVPTTSDITQVPPEEPTDDPTVDGGAVDGGAVDGGMIEGGTVDGGIAVMPEINNEGDTAAASQVEEDPEDGESVSSDSLESSPMEGLAR